MAVHIEKEIKSFGGRVLKLTHESTATRTPMRLNVFLPPRPSKAPVLFYLAGLASTGDNGLEKGGFLGPAAERNIAIVFPDTSPRTAADAALPGEHDYWDFGSGAGFYIDATEEPWAQHYRMETYITEELPKLLADQFPELDWTRKSIFGHSMGGHGALTLFLRHPGMFRSVSAFAPISNPIEAPWGKKAFDGYYGAGKHADLRRGHDATALVKELGAKLPSTEVLIDLGTADQFRQDGQLLVENLVDAAQNSPLSVNLRVRDGYDHGYFFISTFGADHIAHHAKYLLDA